MPSTAEPFVHTIVGAQFGDLEFDVGKSVRWVDVVHRQRLRARREPWNTALLDRQLGRDVPRRPATRSPASTTSCCPPSSARSSGGSTSLEFGEPDDERLVPVARRPRRASASTTARCPTTTPSHRSRASSGVRSSVLRMLGENIGRAAVLRLPALGRHRQRHLRRRSARVPSGDVPPVMQALSVPYYQPHQGLRRLWKASELKKPDFDWSQLDAPTAPSASAKAADPQLRLRPLEPAGHRTARHDGASAHRGNDDGWRMRKLLSKVRPIPGLPLADTWIPPDQRSRRPPWAVGTGRRQQPGPDSTPHRPAADGAAGGSGPLAGGLVTPLYDCVFRLNMRDGVWYEDERERQHPAQVGRRAPDLDDRLRPRLTGRTSASSRATTPTRGVHDRCHRHRGCARRRRGSPHRTAHQVGSRALRGAATQLPHDRLHQGRPRHRIVVAQAGDAHRLGRGDDSGAVPRLRRLGRSDRSRSSWPKAGRSG